MVSILGSISSLNWGTYTSGSSIWKPKAIISLAPALQLFHEHTNRQCGNSGRKGHSRCKEPSQSHYSQDIGRGYR